MKARTFWVAAALLGAGCAPGATPEPPRFPGLPGVELARFAGEVDPATGTVAIRMLDASSPGSARDRVVIPSGASSVTIANSGSAWNNAKSPTAACSNANVTGANVIITQKYGQSSSPSFLGAVYAQIDTVSASGTQACNNAPKPTGLSDAYGLWSYGSLNWGTPTAAAASSTVEWDWTWTSGSRFTFSGTIQGVMGDLVSTGLDPACNWYSCIVYDGSHVVYASASTARLLFVNLDGSHAITSDLLPAKGTSLAADAVNGRVWFTTEELGGTGYAGYLSTTGTDVASRATAASAPTLGSIVIDPDGATKAWFLETVTGSGGGSWVYSITVGAPPVLAFKGLGTGVANGLAILGSGAAKRIYVTYRGLDIIEQYDSDVVLQGTVSSGTLTAAGCRGPAEIISDTAGGKLWFSAETSGAVCTLTPALSVAQVGAITNPRGLVQAPSNDRVWAVSFSDTTTPGQVQRMIPGDPPFPVAVPGTSTLQSITASPAVAGTPAYPEALWITNGAGGLVRLRP